MREHLMRWLQLELSPADAAILAEMHASEPSQLQDDDYRRRSNECPHSKTLEGFGNERSSLDHVGENADDQDNHDDGDEDAEHGKGSKRRRPYSHNSHGAARLPIWEMGRPNMQDAKSIPQG